MRRRLLTAMLLVAAMAVAGFGLPLALSVQALYRDEALLVVSEEAARAVVAVPASFARTNDLPELPAPRGGVDVALYGADGQLLVGTGPPRADAEVDAALRGARSAAPSSALVVASPISDEESVVGAVRASLPPGAVAERTRSTWLAMAGLAVVVLLAAGLLAAARSRALTQPLERLRADAAVIGGGGEVPSRPPTGILEIDAVQGALRRAATTLNGALARERSFGADLAHQLRTPLASLRLRLETEQVHGASGGEVLVGALADVDRLQQTIDDLLALARDTESVREPHPLATLLREAVDRWLPRATSAGRRLELRAPDHLPWTRASPAAVRQILDVLVDNALTHGGGDVLVSGSRLGEGAVLSVTDHGDVVVDAQAIFVRRSPEAAGSGIGLALARRLAEAEDLRLVLADAGPGVAFHLVFGGSSAGR